jgi:hypothetical protein
VKIGIINKATIGIAETRRHFRASKGRKARADKKVMGFFIIFGYIFFVFTHQ